MIFVFRIAEVGVTVDWMWQTRWERDLPPDLELRGPGLALGVDEKTIYEENVKSDLTQGQVIAIGTDGIWEARSKAGEMYGKNRFCDIIRHHAHAGAEDIIDAVFRDLRTFTAGMRPEDDVTLVVVKYDAKSPKKSNS